jgi:hypothetical protein
MKEKEKIKFILEEARKWGLEYEGLTSAFKHEQDFPRASFLECLEVGYLDWLLK